MQITVSLLPSSVPPPPSEAAIAVVVDVLRATTVMAVAVEAGATQVVTFAEVPAARAYAAGAPLHLQSRRPMLAGERHCRRLPGFDLGNSPAEYTADAVGARTLVLTTTNGTQALVAALPYPTVLTAAFVNLEAVLRRLAQETVAQETVVQVICAGTEGAITGEDALCAGAVVANCQQRWQARPANDEAALVADAWRHHFPVPDQIPSVQLTGLLAASQGGRNLRDRGFGDDIARCAAVNQIAALPQRIGRDPIRIAAAIEAPGGVPPPR